MSNYNIDSIKISSFFNIKLPTTNKEFEDMISLSNDEKSIENIDFALDIDKLKESTFFNMKLPCAENEFNKLIYN